MKTFLRTVAAWMAGLLLLLWRLTCRYQRHNDPRPALKAAGTPYVYALLHAHQVAAVFCSDDRIAAMVSRSADGDLLVPALRLRRIRVVRGSSRKAGQDKGGGEALAELTALCQRGVPALLAVDGPRGPRNGVQPGVAKLALAAHATILPMAVLPSRRWLLRRTWDRLQLPKGFCTIHLYFSEPITAKTGESVDALRQRIKIALDGLEDFYDPEEARHAARRILPAKNHLQAG